jgi:DNA-binding ferritin-like protein
MDSVSAAAALTTSRDLVYEPDSEAGEWIMVVAREGVPTVDGRIFEKDALTWREPPIPLLMIRENDPSGQGGHKGAFAAGTITDMWREDGEDGNATIYGRGYFSTDDKGQEARALVKEGVISGVSADVGGAVVEELEADGENEVRRVIKRGTVVSVTALPIPAFNETKIAIVAAASDASWTPPADWFARPSFDGPTPITVTPDGRVFGHAAVWGTCHVGHQAKCVTPPRSRSNYQFFNVGQVVTADGKPVNVGRLTAGTNHANIAFGAQPASEHYDNTGWAGAYVHAGEDDHGIWFAGAVSPTATPEQVAVLRAASVSGDWRNINGALEMVGLLAVNSPGFPVARAGMVAGAQMSLVAAGTIAVEEAAIDEDCGCDEASEEFAIVDAPGNGSSKGNLVDCMKTLLSNSVSIYHEAHGFHWNVKGQDFAQYHDLFGSIYADIYESIDPIAENILKVGYDAPFHLSQFMQFADIPETMSVDTPDSMARALLGQVNKLIDCLNTCFAAATSVNEQGIANFVAERIDASQKWAWQLRSSVGLQTGDTAADAAVAVMEHGVDEDGSKVEVGLPVIELALLDLDVLLSI